MKGSASKKARKHEETIAALLSCKTLAMAAKKSGIGEATLWRWMQEPEFQKSYRAARRQVVEGSIGRLQQATSEAVDALKRNLTCGTPSVEVSAARAILEQSLKAVETMDFEERIGALELKTGGEEC